MARDPYQYFRVEARELLEELTQGFLAVERAGLDKQQVARLLRLAHTLKGAARVVRQTEISESAHRVEDILARYREAEGRLSHDEIEELLKLVDDCGRRVGALALPPVETPTSAPPSPERETGVASIRVDVAAVDSLLATVNSASARLAALREEMRSLEQAKRTRNHRQRTSNALRPGISRSREAGDAPRRAPASEKEASLERLYRAINDNLERLEQDILRVRNQAGDLRLIQASTVFAVLERTIRDAADAQNKQIAFETQGGHQRLDAHVLSRLRDALVQLVRNAAVHGIEPAADRVCAGKPPGGIIRLGVERVAERVVFRVEDDGRGLDLEAIRSIAVKRGSITSTDAERLDIDGAARLLFQGGVSTARQVSELSGRGVGLDLAHSTAARLNGEVRLSSVPGQGTKVEISVPISIECVSVLAASLEDTTVLFPFSAVRRTARIASPQMIRSNTGDAIVIDGTPIPFRHLSSLLHPTVQRPDSSASGSVIVVQSENRQVAVGVDRLDGIRDAVVRPLPELCGPVPLIAGAALDGRGNAELLLDPAHLVSSVLDGPSHETIPDPVPPSTVLVVDDSLTTRMLEQSILESAGYRVEVATSGEEALQRARQCPHALFLVDAEMPGMSGFELLRCFQTDSVLQKVPAIMVTSRASPEDRRCAADVGARDYIVKSEFDERRLLQSIRELIDEVRQ